MKLQIIPVRHFTDVDVLEKSAHEQFYAISIFWLDWFQRPREPGRQTAAEDG